MFLTERCWAKFELMKELLVLVEVDCLHSQSVILRGQRTMQVHCRSLKKFQIAWFAIYIPGLVVKDNCTNGKACRQTRSRVNQSRPLRDIYCCRRGNVHLFLLIHPGARTD